MISQAICTVYCLYFIQTWWHFSFVVLISALMEASKSLSMPSVTSLWIWEGRVKNSLGPKHLHLFLSHHFPSKMDGKQIGLSSQSHLQLDVSAVGAGEMSQPCQCGVVFWCSAELLVFHFRGCVEETSAARPLRPRSTAKWIEWQFWLSVNYSWHLLRQTWAPLLFLKHFVVHFDIKANLSQDQQIRN